MKYFVNQKALMLTFNASLLTTIVNSAVLVLRNHHKNFSGKLTKVGIGVCYLGAQNFNASFVKLKLYNIISNTFFSVFD